MPDTLFHDEFLCLTPGEKKGLRNRGLEVRDLPGEFVERATDYFNRHRRLKLNDCFALALSEHTDDSILLTGDALMRSVAEDNGVEVRGVLWVIDELEARGIVSLQRLHEVLRLFHEDDLVFLPEAEILCRIRRIAKRI